MSTTQHCTPDRVMQTMFSHIPAQALRTGLEFDLFTLIHQGKTTVPALAEASGASERGLFLLTNALCAMGFLTKQDDVLGLSPDAEQFLVSTSRAYLGGMRTQLAASWETWNKLPEAVRTGTTPQETLEGDRGGYFAPWVDALFNLNFPAAQCAAEKLASKSSRVLDIGAGSGVWSLAMATVNPQAEVVVVELPEVVEQVTRPFSQRLGVESRYTFRTEDFHQADFGEAEFDLAILGHILHSEGDELCAELLARLSRALKPGGSLLVAEMIPDEERRQDAFGNFFGLNMLVHTHAGTVYTRSELEAMTTRAGFHQHEWLQAPAPFPLLVCHKSS